MNPKHLLLALLLALLVVVIWGLNFIFISIGLKGFPPLLMCALRFALAAFPAVLFLPRPKVGWPILAAFGLVNFGMQFALLFTGMRAGMSAGLASLVMQTQVFITVGMAAALLKDRPSAWKIIGALISFSGVGVVAWKSEDGSSLVGLVLTLLASFCWATGNLLSKKIAAESPLALVAWGSLIAFPPLLLASLALEGPDAIAKSATEASWLPVLALLYVVYFSTHVGYSLWGHLLQLYPAAVVAPFTLLESRVASYRHTRRQALLK